MDRGLQERLVGAAVLVALGVWLIPWVLDGSAADNATPNEEIVLKLPAPDDSASTVIRRQTIDLGASRGSLLKSSAADEDAAADTQTGRTEAPADATPAPAPETAPAPAQPRVVQATADEQEAARSAEVAAQPVQRAPPPQGVPASHIEGWMVQLGSFSDAGNAQRQAQRIGTYGHDASIYEFAAAGGRTMFRVRLGPLTSRDRAQATASSLQAHGFVAQVIAPE